MREYSAFVCEVRQATLVRMACTDLDSRSQTLRYDGAVDASLGTLRPARTPSQGVDRHDAIISGEVDVFADGWPEMAVSPAAPPLGASDPRRLGQHPGAGLRREGLVGAVARREGARVAAGAAQPHRCPPSHFLRRRPISTDRCREAGGVGARGAFRFTPRHPARGNVLRRTSARVDAARKRRCGPRSPRGPLGDRSRVADWPARRAVHPESVTVPTVTSGSQRSRSRILGGPWRGPTRPLLPGQHSSNPLE